MGRLVQTDEISVWVGPLEATGPEALGGFDFATALHAETYTSPGCVLSEWQAGERRAKSSAFVAEARKVNSRE